MASAAAAAPTRGPLMVLLPAVGALGDAKLSPIPGMGLGLVVAVAVAVLRLAPPPGLLSAFFTSLDRYSSTSWRACVG